MNPNLIFWAGALCDLGLAAVCISAGFLQIRAQNYIWHQRLMRAATVLIVIFLIGYVFKLVFLGKEDFSDWTPNDLLVLYIHESFMFVLILCGAAALYLQRKFVKAIEHLDAPPAGRVEFRSGEDRARRWHRWLGRSAVIAALFGLLTAAVVLQGMYRRAAEPGQVSSLLKGDRQSGS
jgi:uncharacterized membrane protein YozB (DUF420 family)